MKIFYSIVVILQFVFLSNSYAQKLYDDPNPLANTSGKRLTIGSTSNALYPGDLLSVEYSDTANYDYKLNLYTDYRRWKFTPNYMIGGYGKAGFEFQKSKFNSLGITSTNETKDISATVFGAASYYLMPNKLYLTGALGVAVNNHKVNTTSSLGPMPVQNIDSTMAPSYLWGAVGYGRINNRQVIEVVYDFDEDLRNRGIIESKLDDKTLRKISEMLYRQADGEYQDKYNDDEYVKLFKDIEAELITSGYIRGKLGAESAVKLYEILRNSSKKYIYYPKYSGYQMQGQVQYQITNETKDKTHEHYLSLSGVYCMNITNNTNMIFSGYYAVPLDTMAMLEAPREGFSSDFQNYLAFLPDRNNLDFFKNYPGTGVYGKRYVPGLRTMYGVRADIFHSLSSVSGIQGTIGIGGRKFKYLDGKIEFIISAKYDYNIYSSLTAYVKAELLR